MAKIAKSYLEIDPWIIEEKGFHTERGKCSESIFALANEFMGARASFEEGYSGESMQGAYFNGIYERGDHHYATEFKGFAKQWTYMVNSVDWLNTKIVWDGVTLDLARVNVRDFNRKIDMRRGVLERSFVWQSNEGRELKITFERFLSMTDSRLGMQRIRFEALNFDGSIELTLALDWNTLYHLRNTRPWSVVQKSCSTSRIACLGRTESSGHRVYAAFETRGAWQPEVMDEPLLCGHRGTIDLTVGNAVSVTRHCSFESEKDVSLSHDQVWQVASAAADQRLSNSSWDSALAEHLQYWEKVWDHLDIVIEGDDANQQGFRYCLFNLHQTYHGADSRFNIGAKGLTGEHYWGVTWWDTETYCLPFYLFNNPTAAKNLMAYRHRTLAGALTRANQLNLTGARYPMCTIDGEETCDVWQHGDLEIHVSAAVAYGVWKTHHITQDDVFLFDTGAEILFQVARFYLSRGGWGQRTGRFGFWGVMGPDEMHMMVNNNAYTNFMAAKSMRFACDAYQLMQQKSPEKFADLTARIQLTSQEVNAWKIAADGMEMMKDEASGIYEQHEGFFNLPHINYQEIPDDQFPVLKKWPYIDLFRYDLIKQPDVLLFQFLFASEFSDEDLRVNMNYYEPRCSHESSLSPAIHSILAARLGRLKQAYDYARYASRLDLDDYNNNTDEGLHVTSMAGAWMNLIYGFGGLQSDGPVLSFRPSIPPGWQRFSFRLLVGDDSLLAVSVSRSEAEFKVLEGGSINLTIFGNLHEVGANPVVVAMPDDRVGQEPKVKAVIFDLDGVIVSTDHFHFLGWKRLADEEGVPFTEADNDRLRGVSRMESLDILLEKSNKAYSEEEKIALAERKNGYYRELLQEITPADILPGAGEWLASLKQAGILVAIGSSSKNTPTILQRIGLADAFDAVADGNDITRSKPHPEVFLLAAERLGVDPEACLVVEDAEAGVSAALAAGMHCLAVGAAHQDERAHFAARDLATMPDLSSIGI
ncbi:MAG: beta-phosphoglucomutase [Verrucomicrobia bacterium]|nr:MAG: beta-phosphoglucomutase [Verrucomicrobiota bacterium]